MAHDRRALVPHVVLLFYIPNFLSSLHRRDYYQWGLCNFSLRKYLFLTKTRVTDIAWSLFWYSIQHLFTLSIRVRIVWVVDIKWHVPLVTMGSNMARDLWIFSCEEDLKLGYGASAVLLRCRLVPEIMHKEAPEDFIF